MPIHPRHRGLYPFDWRQLSASVRLRRADGALRGPWRSARPERVRLALAEAVTTLAASTLASRRRALERRLDDLLAPATTGDIVRAVQDKIRRAPDHLLTFTFFPGQVEPTNNPCERDLRPAVIQRKITNRYRSTWSA